MLGEDLYLFDGEVEPGLRATMVGHGGLRRHDVEWSGEQRLPLTDGLAGSFAGVLAPSAWDCNKKGQYFAPDGLVKTWFSEVFMLQRGEWRLAGHLPCPRANSLRVEVHGALLIVGGATAGEAPCLDAPSLAPPTMPPSRYPP